MADAAWLGRYVVFWGVKSGSLKVNGDLDFDFINVSVNINNSIDFLLINFRLRKLSSP